jgi:hypothetical protein
MRGFMLRALPVCFAALATGCFLMGNSVAPDSAKPAASATHAYWQGANAALAQKAAGADLKSLVALVRAQTDALRELSPEGVDQTLAAAVEDVIKCEERVIEVAEMFNGDVAALKTNQAMAKAFADANRQAEEAKKRLRALRGPLNDRHGGGFASLGG